MHTFTRTALPLHVPNHAQCRNGGGGGVLSFEEIMARKRERQNREASSERGRGRRSMSPDRRSSPPPPRREREDVRGSEHHHHDRHSGRDVERHDPRDDFNGSAASARAHRDLDRADHTSFRGREDRARGDSAHSYERSLSSDYPHGNRNDRYDDARSGRVPKELAEPPADPRLRPLDDDPRGGKMYRQTTHGRKGNPRVLKKSRCDLASVSCEWRTCCCC